MPTAHAARAASRRLRCARRATVHPERASTLCANGEADSRTQAGLARSPRAEAGRPAAPPDAGTAAHTLSDLSMMTEMRLGCLVTLNAAGRGSSTGRAPASGGGAPSATMAVASRLAATLAAESPALSLRCAPSSSSRLRPRVCLQRPDLNLLTAPLKRMTAICLVLSLASARASSISFLVYECMMPEKTRMMKSAISSGEST
mmetsp:Transcript_51640/g.142984  ORF Transcript_51640/g.142984 Transcript_51640/m.142984 type:complete len:203 (-) Transcript_51640:713-1321(-)